MNQVQTQSPTQEVLFQQMLQLANIGQLQQAFQISEQIIAMNPNADGVYFHQALMLNRTEQNDLAYERQLKALKIAPDNAHYHFNAAIYAAGIDDLIAMMHYERCLHIEPNHIDALWNYSELLRLDGHISMAVDCLHRLIALGKDDFDMFYNRLVACYTLLPEYSDKAQELYKKLFKDKNDKIARWGYALEELKHERFDTGFEYYNRRFEISRINNAYCYDFPYPLWDGEFKQGQTILFHGEQGLGDEMMFVSPMHEILEEAAKYDAKIIIACKKPLVRLFQYSFPTAQVFAHKYDDPAKEVAQLKIDAQMPLGHILRRNRQTMADFDHNRRAFFKADPQRVAYYNERIKIQGRESIDGKRRFRVGLMWGTVPAETVKRFVRNAVQKSIPLPMFQRFSNLVDDVEFVSLQNKDRYYEAALVPELMMVDFGTDQDDFFDTAAIIENLDLVITVCTSVSHLAGGLEAETWLPLMFTPDWRHGDKRQTSYWYNNTRYFNQEIRNNWYPVMDELYDALCERIKLNRQ